MGRHVLEGEWTGYTSAQRQVVHREIISAARAKSLKVRAIVYTDGTSLLLRIRPAEPRETITEKHGYTSLIRDAELHGAGKSRVLVADLP